MRLLELLSDLGVLGAPLATFGVLGKPWAFQELPEDSQDGPGRSLGDPRGSLGVRAGRAFDVGSWMLRQHVVGSASPQ